MTESVTYKDAGVDIDKADALKEGLKSALQSDESRVLNAVGAFSSLFDVSNMEGIQHPVLCLKMEEPGSKQLLAAQHGALARVGEDLVNHLINDTVMNGGKPLAILDTIVCGSLDNEVVRSLIDTMMTAAQREGCSLVGGETSEQPRVLDQGTYILSAACVGIVDRSKIIDGSAIREGDTVYGVASNGVHTNGYTLVRSLLEKNTELHGEMVGDRTVIDAVLEPHLCYNTPLQKVFQHCQLSGLSHITGGGIVDNTARVLPKGVDAVVSLDTVKVLPLFSTLRRAGNIPHSDMLRTFNCGVGMIFIGPQAECESAASIFREDGFHAYKIGTITTGSGKVITQGELAFV